MLNYLEFISEAYKIQSIRKYYDTNIYYFNSDNFEYSVKITRYQGVKTKKYYSVGFGIIEDDLINYNTSIITNDNIYQMIETVINIMIKFTKENNVDGFIFSFTGDKIKNTQRLKLYKKVIEKNFPESTVEYNDGIYYIHLK